MRDFPATPIEMVASLWRNRSLIHALAKREVLGRYRGSALGLLWSFFNPLFMLVIYTFVFSVVLKDIMLPRVSYLVTRTHLAACWTGGSCPYTSRSPAGTWRAGASSVRKG